ncbi:putative ankyrin repeat domain-containing protein 31 [Notechis scutatus]|uniref:Ankyrin repeat domain-containing protein 31 n=1 Tax=Notechis scutatus TaxID=8663 RepID=A0A6J1U7B7_9SAUR|nr:putative ankyrin repeat domain-containing protein 31 [Notechis scutatus]
MMEVGEVSDTDSDETIVEGFVVESHLEEKGLRAKRFSSVDKDMVLARETSITSEVANTYGDLEHKVPRVLKMSYQNVEETLPSNMNAVKSFSNDVPKYPGTSVAFQSVGMIGGKSDAADNDLIHEAIASNETINSVAAKMFVVKPLDEFETNQIPDMLEYQNDYFSIDTSVNEENNTLPEELFTALNTLTESVVAVEGRTGSSTTVKQLTPEQAGDDATEIIKTDLKSQCYLQCHEEPKTVMIAKMSCTSGEQIDYEQCMHPLCHPDPQKTGFPDRPFKKGNSSLKDIHSCEHLFEATSYTLKKSEHQRKTVVINDTDATFECQPFLEGMHQKMHRFNDRDKEYESLQLGICTYHCSSSDANTKIEQVRKSQRIAKKTRKQTIFNYYSNDSSGNYTSLSVINRRDAFGQTLLHRAATEDDLDGVCAMIKAGANVNAQDYAGWTPLHESSLAGWFEISNELLKAGADVNCKGYEHVTPLHDAVKEGHYKVAELLLWYGADPLFKNERGKNALEEATDKHMRKLVESYIAHSDKRSASENLEVCCNMEKEKEKQNFTSDVPFQSVALKTVQTKYNGNCQNANLGSGNNVKNVSSSNTQFSQIEEQHTPRILDLYIQDFSEIQNSLNTTLTRQKSERDELAKKYRASVESFKQGVLREKLVSLAARQKNLLLMARKQKELWKKIQNFKNAKKEGFQLSNQVPDTLDSYENSNTKNRISDETVPCPNIIMGHESVWEMENSSLNQDHPNRFPDISGENGEINSQKKDGPQLLVFENNVKRYNTAEVTNSESLDTTDSATLLLNSVICPTQQLKEIDCILVTPQETQNLSATSRLQINNSTIGSDNNNICQPSTDSQNVCMNMLLSQYSNMNNASSIQPIVELESACGFVSTDQDNMATSKRILLNVNLESPGPFSHVTSQSTISQNTFQNSKNQDFEKGLHFKRNRKKKNQLLDLLELGKIKPGDDVLEFTLQDSKHKASLLGNGKVQTGNNSVYQNPVQWIKAILGKDIYVTYCGRPLSTIVNEMHVPKESEVLQQKNLLDSSCQANSSKTPCFLHFNKIRLITDEEFLPWHTGEKYWDFFVKCENFGF